MAQARGLEVDEEGVYGLNFLDSVRILLAEHKSALEAVKALLTFVVFDFEPLEEE
jgi:hypothetical protein